MIGKAGKAGTFLEDRIVNKGYNIYREDTMPRNEYRNWTRWDFISELIYSELIYSDAMFKEHKMWDDWLFG